MPFIGAKAAFFCHDQILCYLRDDHAGLAWAGHWDLPGGGREAGESPQSCLLRELEEEFGLRFAPDRLTTALRLPSMQGGPEYAWFFAGRITPDDIAAIRFGDEGQYWQMMPVAEFLNHPQGIAPLQARVARVWPDYAPKS